MAALRFVLSLALAVGAVMAGLLFTAENGGWLVVLTALAGGLSVALLLVCIFGLVAVIGAALAEQRTPRRRR